MLNDKSQGSVAALLRCGGLFTYHFITYLAKLQAKRFIALMCPVCLTVQITFDFIISKYQTDKYFSITF